MSARPLITANSVSKRFGAQTLFSGLTLPIFERDRLGIIGPNGAGKSTLLKLLAGLEEADDGDVLKRRDLRISYVSQVPDFGAASTVLDAAMQAAQTAAASEAERQKLVYTSLAALQLQEHQTAIEDLSGGQQKRLQLAIGLCTSPDLLLLDEPTNHLDIQAIISLEELLSKARFSWVAVTHDRWFLENAVHRIAELQQRYPGGVLHSEGGYQAHLFRRQQYLEAELKQRNALENKVRNEQAWLRQGPRARTTKAKGRISSALELMESLSLVRAKQSEKQVTISFDHSERKTKKLLQFFNVSKRFGENLVLDQLKLTIVAGEALGILGENGSGKSTFVRLLTGELEPDNGTIKRAADLSIAYFRQIEQQIDGSTPLQSLLVEDGDSVLYRGRSLHVATYAKKFRFSFEQLQQPYATLSGGERARARIAKLMLQAPDVLVLDEPTNDLDIETLEMLEEGLADYQGALILVTHDRFMINRLCTSFLGLLGNGRCESFAEYQQWERAMQQNTQSKDADEKVEASTEKPKKPKSSSKRLSYMEQREYDGIEKNIETVESEIEELQQQLSLDATRSDADKLNQLCLLLEEKQATVERLYARWQELEEKQK